MGAGEEGGRIIGGKERVRHARVVVPALECSSRGAGIQEMILQSQPLDPRSEHAGMTCGSKCVRLHFIL
jgi:hypothetical protein